MIQFNLLPDVKLEYIKARRTKRLVILGSSIATGVSVALAVILVIGVNVVQRQHLNHLRSDIHRDSQKLKGEKDLDKILTVQNQLNSLNGLHESKPATERLAAYLSQTTPLDVVISDLQVDFAASTMNIKGIAAQLKPINVFIDTLKFTKYKSGDQTANAFSNVVLTAFTRDDESSDAPATYELTLSFDPTIFDNTKEVSLEVPAGVTTRSTTEKPGPLFQSQPETQMEEGH
jgi:hypothetical protein